MRRITYKDAGVDIEAGEQAVKLMRQAVQQTHNEQVLEGLADFGGMYALGKQFLDPVLVSGTDGVGTKLKIAFALDKHNTVGQDLVAMCVDDIVCQGARPLLFLDYLATGELEPETVAEVVGGIAAGCKLAGCALLGGETAELPGFYAPGEYDMAGFAVGVVERQQIIDGSAVQAGDVLVGIASSGLHSNGYSLVRKVLLEVEGLSLEEHISELGRALGEELLEPTIIYAPALVELFEANLRPDGLAHITGGGIPGNLERIIPEGLSAIVDRSAFSAQPIFGLVQRLGNVPPAEMYRTFNMGVGMVIVVSSENCNKTVDHLNAAGHSSQVIGEITSASSDIPPVMLK